MASEELLALNSKIAKAAVTGRLDKNPLLQGILAQAINRMDREEQGLQFKGPSAASETEREILHDAAINLAIMGGSRKLAAQLGQKKRKPALRMSEMPHHGLPNPGLSLMLPSQLEENIHLADLRFPRAPDSRVRRLMMAVDATYLLKTFVQCEINGTAGLVGGCWSSASTLENRQDFLPIGTKTQGLEKAPQILEFLLWDPCGRGSRETVSIGAMPMSLAAPASEDGEETQSHRGNLDP